MVSAIICTLKEKKIYKMGRQREFDADDLLEKAMLAFWKNGFDRTSMRQVEAVTGVKQASIYNVYGDKNGLFLAVLDRYADFLLSTVDKHLGNRDLEGISSFVDSIVNQNATFRNVNYGCLMVNTAAQIADAAGPAAWRRMSACRAELVARMLAALERAKARGKLRRELNLGECAEFLVSVIWGVFVTIRQAGGDQTVGIPVANVLNRTIRDWRANAN